METNKLAIIILNYNSWQDTLNEAMLCNSLMKVDYKNIIIVDNSSPNDSVEHLESESLKKNFIFLKSKLNCGYAAGNNIGLRYAFNHGFKYAFILNNDILIKDSNLINKLLDVFRQDSNVAVVNPDVYSTDGHLFNRDVKRPTFYDYTIGLISYKKKGRDIKKINNYGYIYRPQGCCMIVDLMKLSEIDYLDENTFLYWEEAILAERLLKKGYLCACNFSTSIVHNHSKTVKSTFNIKRIININNNSFSYYLKMYRNYNNLQIKICCFFNSLKLTILEKM